MTLDATLITAIFGGLVLIIGAVFKGLVELRKIHFAVNSNLSASRDEVATLRAELKAALNASVLAKEVAVELARNAGPPKEHP